MLEEMQQQTKTKPNAIVQYGKKNNFKLYHVKKQVFPYNGLWDREINYNPVLKLNFNLFKFLRNNFFYSACLASYFLPLGYNNENGDRDMWVGVEAEKKYLFTNKSKLRRQIQIEVTQSR